MREPHAVKIARVVLGRGEGVIPSSYSTKLVSIDTGLLYYPSLSRKLRTRPLPVAHVTIGLHQKDDASVFSSRNPS